MKDVLRKGMCANDLAMIADKTRTTGSVGGMEGGVQEARMCDVCLTSERGLEH